MGIWGYRIRAAAALALGMSLLGCQQIGNGTATANDPAAVDAGIVMLETGQFRQAVSHFRNLAPFRTQNDRTLMGLAIAADMEGDFRLSTRAYDELAATARADAAYFNNLGYSHMLRGELKQAYVNLRRAERMDPANPLIQNNLRMLRSVLTRNVGG